MKKTIACGLLLMSSLVSEAQSGPSEREAVERALQNYIQGTSFNHQSLIRKAFSADANLLLDHPERELWRVSAKEYSQWFKADKKGQFNGRIGEILSIDIANTIATAKVEILMPDTQQRYVDMFLLKKLSDGWKITNKSATGAASKRHGERILFVVSNAHFHGESALPAGVSFSEIVKAHKVFMEAGYTVDFVSPQGGAIPLSYINTSVPEHKAYLYNSDFMYAIGHTLKPEQVQPADYRAVHYVGGSNAMYGVADNQAIQNITMEIYEEHGGVVSSVCHGTAGIVNLKTRDGRYLVNGKRISGYPEVYESKTRDYFKHFPFLIQQTIERHGGHFFYSERGTPHVEVDGRIVTGQNHLSSPMVARKMIEILNREKRPLQANRDTLKSPSR